MPEKEIRRIASTLFGTLEQLHNAGVVVQDIKPENVLITDFDEPVFADFGIASVIGHATKIMPTSIKGTFNYMAPETFSGKEFGVEVDIWSMACLVNEMSTGMAPWHDLQMQQIMCAVVMEKKSPKVSDSVPEAKLVRQCLSHSPAARPTASDMAVALLKQPKHSLQFGKSKQDHCKPKRCAVVIALQLLVKTGVHIVVCVLQGHKYSNT